MFYSVKELDVFAVLCTNYGLALIVAAFYHDVWLITTTYVL